MVSEKDCKEMSAKLDVVIKLLAGIMLKDMSLTDRITTLKSLGFERKDIAVLSGTTPAAVTTYLWNEGRKTRGKGKKAKSDEES